MKTTHSLAIRGGLRFPVTLPSSPGGASLDAFIRFDSENDRCTVTIPGDREYVMQQSRVAEVVANRVIRAEAPPFNPVHRVRPPAWTQVGSKPLSTRQLRDMFRFTAHAEIGDGRPRPVSIFVDHWKDLLAVETDSPRYIDWESRAPGLKAADSKPRVYWQPLSSVAQMVVQWVTQTERDLLDLDPLPTQSLLLDVRAA